MSYQQQPTNDGFDTLYSTKYGQTFHSTHGAFAESEHVFLRGSGVAGRLAARLPTRVLEVGFGTGLNFLVAAQQCQNAGASLHYVALEKELLPVDVLTQLNYGAMLESDIWENFLAWRNSLPNEAVTSVLQWKFGPNIQMEVLLGDATRINLPQLNAHAIYHDAFSPDANPELWTQQFFARLFPLLEPGGKLTTYSVKGTVRRNLQAVGFKVQKQPGPPGKREMLVAIKQN